MGEFLKQIREWLKTPAHYFLPLLLITTFGLFAPEWMLKEIGIIKWRHDYNFYLGSVFIISFFFVSCHYSIVAIKWVSDRVVEYSAKRIRIKRIKSLTLKEQVILAKYFKTNSKTVGLFYPSGVVAGLEAAEIIYPSSTEGFDQKTEFNIQEWAWVYIKNNIRVLEPFVNEIRECKRIRDALVNAKKQSKKIT